MISDGGRLGLLGHQGPGDIETSAARSGAEPGLQRWTTGLNAPWEDVDWNSQELVGWLQQEQKEVDDLYNSVLSHETQITKSVMARPAVKLTWKDVGFEAVMPDKSKKTILEPVSGHCEGGELVAVMGPSGCGKSTLLDMLAMKKTAAYTGEILVNGHPRDHLFQRIAAYVGQEDVMPQFWTVREAVTFNSMLKSPELTNVPKEVLQNRLDGLLSAFGLSSVADTYIGGPLVRGCSGGQRRRVTLARGVAQRASLLFADEPTSGLSATDAESCIKALKIIAKKYNILVMVVIHQPRVEVADLFDRLILLTARPGRMVYNGSMQGALDYWAQCGHPVPAHSNPTDFYLDLVTPGGPKDCVDEFVGHYKSKQQPAIDALVEQNWQERGMTPNDMLRSVHQVQQESGMGPDGFRAKPIAVGFSRQMGILLRRKVLLTRRNPATARTTVFIPVFVGILMGIMFMGIGHKPFASQLSFIFMLLSRICMGGMQLMPALIDDRNVMKYDTSEALYGVEAFIFVNSLVDVSVALLAAVLNFFVMYAFAGISFDYCGLILGWAVVNFFVFDSFFGALAAYAPNASTAQVCALPFNAIFMMFSGFMISKVSAPGYLMWIFQISPIGYATESIFTTMAKDFGAEGQKVVDQYGFVEGEEAKGLCVMLAMFVLLRVLQVCFFKYRNNIQK